MKNLLVAVLAAAIIAICSSQDCGQGPSRVSSRIVGGTVATQNFPWQVALFYNHRFTCGGSIIANSWIVTAAHCLRGRSTRGFLVVYGTRNYQDRRTRRITSIRRYILHRGYNPRNFANDIALIQLRTPLAFNRVVGKVCIPRTSVPDNTMVTATGFGLLTNGGVSSRLYQVEIPVVSRASCAAAYGNSFRHIRHICAGSRGKGTCSGDSGGPVVFNRNNRWELQGIVSAGPTTCTNPQTKNIGINARVVHFRNWIQTECKCL